jgi:DNA gyrase subunit B
MTDADVDGSHIRTLLLTFFYRQMPELVKRGHIFIAQPPLYLITRRKKEEYVQDDAQLAKILISLSLEEVRLRKTAEEKELTKGQLKEVIELLERLDRLAGSIRRHGGDFETYLSKRDNGSENLPQYLVNIRDGNTDFVEYFMTDEALRNYSSENPDLNLFDHDIESAATNGTAAPKTGQRRRARLVELHESSTVEKVLAEMAKKGFEVEHYSAQDKPLYEIIEGEGDKVKVHPLFSIPEILAKVMEIGRQGLEIKRFKGLGEMNPKQLFETTMNPEKRRLLRVALNEDNAVEADRMFTILMGDIVEPRRQFIEDNALNVRNLDV